MVTQTGSKVQNIQRVWAMPHVTVPGKELRTLSRRSSRNPLSVRLARNDERRRAHADVHASMIFCGN